MKRLLMTILVALFAVVLAGCATATKAAEPSEQPTPAVVGKIADPDGNVVVHVSNQSISRSAVDIEVSIDDQIIASETFEVGDQHRWKRFEVHLDAGLHVLKARSVDGRASLEETFTVDGKHWIGLSYWYNTRDNGTPQAPIFHFKFQDEEFQTL